MTYRVQEPPNAVQVELTEGCNLRCPFCGLNGIRGPKRDYKFMSTATAVQLATLMARADWNARIEFAMHGEPTLHPEADLIVGLFRAALPRVSLMMTSNGGGLLRKPGPTYRIWKLMDAGLNVLALDDYQHANIVPRIREAWYGDDGTPMYRTYEYPRDRDGNPHARRGYTEHDVVFIEAIDIAKGGTHASLNNHCGAAAPLNESAQGKKCAKPFRELSVRWDGAVAVCCNDWRGVMKIGNVNEVGHIDEIWQHPAMGAIRRYLYHGMRTEGPCRGCDALSYRPGLLPDRKGLEALPQPTDADRATVRAVCAGAPMTLPVLREWEAAVQPKKLARKS